MDESTKGVASYQIGNHNAVRGMEAKPLAVFDFRLQFRRLSSWRRDMIKEIP